MTEQERNENIEREVEEAVSTEPPSRPPLRFTLFPPSPEALNASANREPGQTHDVMRNRIRHITYQIAGLAMSVYGADRVSTDVVIDGRRKFYPDLLISPARKGMGKLLEVKYLSAPMNLRNRVSDGLVQAARGANLVSAVREATYGPVFVLVYEDALYENTRERFEQEVSELESSFTTTPVVLGIGRLSLDSIAAQDFRDALERD